MKFVNRERELGALERWWARPGEGLALVWGRRRVGKTWILRHFSAPRSTVFHTGGGRPRSAELALLSRRVADADLGIARDLATRPFVTWDEALDALAVAARDRPLLLVLDEFPELVDSEPALPGIIRAFWDRAQTTAELRIILCGSAVRAMFEMQQRRAPLYGRFGTVLQIHPFAPHEAALMLPGLDPSTRALVWGLVGGVPLYLSWWDQDRSVEANLAELVCEPDGRLLSEGQLVLATEGDAGRLTGPVMSAIAMGRTNFNEIAEAVGTDPSRVLERLVNLRLVERLTPVTEDARRTRRRLYRVADNFMAFWLGVVDRYRSEIEQGLGRTVLGALTQRIDGHMGGRWEEAFRAHLRRLTLAGELEDDVVAIGPFWRADGQNEIDAVALAGVQRRVVLLGEAKWSRQVRAPRVEAALRRKAASVPGDTDAARLAIAARERVDGAAAATLCVTARDIFTA